MFTLFMRYVSYALIRLDIIGSLINAVMLCSLTVFIILFFFKQKTAYEMRISDWSSDVCSSDLPCHLAIGFVEFDESELEISWIAGMVDGSSGREIGRASCRERVCQYV